MSEYVTYPSWECPKCEYPTYPHCGNFCGWAICRRCRLIYDPYDIDRLALMYPR